MKESFWGVLIVMLGLFGVMLINVFQKITIGNDEVYYLLKETNEAAMYDSINFSYYRLTGDIKIVEDKFAENFARRFGQNIMMRGNYKITIQDVNEVPPRLSVKVVSKITSLAGDEFGIENRIDGILEAKYKLEEITDFLGITKEEWVNRSNINDVKGDTNSKACVITTIEDTSECMEGDIELSSWEDVRLSDKICQTDEAKNVNREINYKVCECGKWKEYTDTVASTIKKEATRYVYTWEYVKEGALREFRVSANAEVEIGVCTTKIEIYVPNKIEERVKNIKEQGTIESSDDNSAYEICPSGGIRIPLGVTVVLHPNYIPSNASNRDIKWKSSEDIVTIVEGKANTSKGFSKAYVRATKIGTTTITAESTKGQKATCKITVWDGLIDNLSCNNVEVQIDNATRVTATYTPTDALYKKIEYSLSDTSIASIDNTGKIIGKKAGKTNIVVKDTKTGKSGMCTLTVKEEPPVPSGGGEYTTDAGDCYETFNEPILITGSSKPVTDASKCGYAVCQTPECGYTREPATCKSECCGTPKEVPKTCTNSCCGKNYKSCRTAACGIKSKKCIGIINKKGKCIGVEYITYKKCEAAACGFKSYKTCTDAKCCGTKTVTEKTTCTRVKCCGYKFDSCPHRSCGPATCFVFTDDNYTYGDVTYKGTLKRVKSYGACVNGSRTVRVVTTCRGVRFKNVISSNRPFSVVRDNTSWIDAC